MAQGGEKKRKRGSRRGYCGDVSSPSDMDEGEELWLRPSTDASSLGTTEGDDNALVSVATADAMRMRVNFYECVRPRKRRRKQTVVVGNVGDVKLQSREDYERKKTQKLRRAYPWFFNCTNDAKSSRVDQTMPSGSSSSSDGGSSSSETENDNRALSKKCSGDGGIFSRPIAVTDDSYLLDSMYNLREVPSSIRRRFSLNPEKEKVRDEEVCGRRIQSSLS